MLSTGRNLVLIPTVGDKGSIFKLCIDPVFKFYDNRIR